MKMKSFFIGNLLIVALTLYAPKEPLADSTEETQDEASASNRKMMEQEHEAKVKKADASAKVADEASDRGEKSRKEAVASAKEAMDENSYSGLGPEEHFPALIKKLNEAADKHEVAAEHLSKSVEAHKTSLEDERQAGRDLSALHKSIVIKWDTESEKESRRFASFAREKVKEAEVLAKKHGIKVPPARQKME